MQIIEIDRADYSALSARGQPDSFLVQVGGSRYMHTQTILVILYIIQRLCPTSATPLWLPQGGSAQGSMLGVSLLADDVVDFIRDSQQRNDIETREMSKNWKVCIVLNALINLLTQVFRLSPAPVRVSQPYC